jgi:hypothetical protein
MASGKPAGIVCAQLTADRRCAIFGLPERPRCCSGLQPHPEMCGDSADQALANLTLLEQLTDPDQPSNAQQQA